MNAHTADGLRVCPYAHAVWQAHFMLNGKHVHVLPRSVACTLVCVKVMRAHVQKILVENYLSTVLRVHSICS